MSKTKYTTREEYINLVKTIALENDWWDIFSTNKQLRLAIIQDFLLIEILAELRRGK